MYFYFLNSRFFSNTYSFLFLSLSADNHKNDRNNPELQTQCRNAEVFGFVLFSGSVDTFNCTFRSSILEVNHHQILESSSSIFKGFIFFQFSNNFLSSVQTTGHFLTHGKWIELTSVYSYDGSTQIICKPIFSFTYNCFTCKIN